MDRRDAGGELARLNSKTVAELAHVRPQPLMDPVANDEAAVRTAALACPRPGGTA